MAGALKIETDFEGSNILIGGLSERRAELAIRADSAASEFRQWFAFRVAGGGHGSSELCIVNAGETTYPDAWDGYWACASHDLVRWYRAPTELDDGRLTIEHRHVEAPTTYAYFAPYSLERHDALVARAAGAQGPERAQVTVLGGSVEGRDIHVLTFGADRSLPARQVWIIGRQHPGETQAEWFADGLIQRLLDAEDGAARELLQDAVVHVVPNMNPDGTVLGNLRTNAAGMNLNRAWLDPDAAASPEVLAVRAAMMDTGVDLFLDVHADERNPYCFLAGCEGNPGYSDRLRLLENVFEQSLCAFDPDFQDIYGYDRDEPGGGDLRTAGNWVGESFDCLAFTVEMPFKDAANHPDPLRGWTPARAQALGAAALQSIAVTLPGLR